MCRYMRRLASLSLTSNVFWSSCSCVLVRLLNDTQAKTDLMAHAPLMEVPSSKSFLGNDGNDL